MTDNALAYRRSHAWREALAELGAKAKFTKRYRPQTNGKAERFNRTLLDEWAYARPYQSEQQRREAFPHWLHTYNHHRGHTALGGKPPASRVPNLSRASTPRSKSSWVVVPTEDLLAGPSTGTTAHEDERARR